MKKQAFKIVKMDWLVVERVGKRDTYHWCANLKEAKTVMASCKSTAQLFKLSYEFRDVVVKK